MANRCRRCMARPNPLSINTFIQTQVYPQRVTFAQHHPISGFPLTNYYSRIFPLDIDVGPLYYGGFDSGVWVDPHESKTKNYFCPCQAHESKTKKDLGFDLRHIDTGVSDRNLSYQTAMLHNLGQQPKLHKVLYHQQPTSVATSVRWS